MTLDPDTIAKLTIQTDITDYVRVIRRKFAVTPLGMGYGPSRFSSPHDRFQVLYLAQDAGTAIAEAVVRNRFEDKARRELLLEELHRFSIFAVLNPKPLSLLDLRGDGAFRLGISTDAVHAKDQADGRKFSQRLHDTTSLDGILYASRLTGGACAAVYERAVPAHLKIADAPVDLVCLASLTDILKDLAVTVITIPR